MNWFTKDHTRDIKLRSAVLLVSAAGQKRIKMFCSLNITNETGDPEWLEEAATFVMQHGHEVKIPEIKIVGQNITMGDDNLFKKRVEMPKSEIRSFVCKQTGDSEEPDTTLEFVIYATFSTDVWKWCGQMGGQEFYMQFDGATPEPGDVVVSPPTLELKPKESEPEPAKEEGDDIDPDAEAEADPKAPRPRDLTPGEDAAFQRAKGGNKLSQSAKVAEAAKTARESTKGAKGKVLSIN